MENKNKEIIIGILISIISGFCIGCGLFLVGGFIIYNAFLTITGLIVLLLSILFALLELAHIIVILEDRLQNIKEEIKFEIFGYRNRNFGSFKYNTTEDCKD